MIYRPVSISRSQTHDLLKDFTFHGHRDTMPSRQPGNHSEGLGDCAASASHYCTAETGGTLPVI